MIMRLAAVQMGLVTLDSTLVFQIINTLFLLLIIIGVPVLVIKFIKSNRKKAAHIESIDKKLDLLLSEIEKSK